MSKSLSFLFSMVRSSIKQILPSLQTKSLLIFITNSWFSDWSRRSTVRHSPGHLFWIYRIIGYTEEWFLRNFVFRYWVVPITNGFFHHKFPPILLANASTCHFLLLSPGFDGEDYLFWIISQIGSLLCDWTHPSIWLICSKTQSFSFVHYPNHFKTDPLPP